MTEITGLMKLVLGDLDNPVVAVIINLINAALILLAGRLLSRYLADKTRTVMEKRGVDSMLTKFVANLTFYALWVFTIVACLAKLGINTTSLAAAVGAIGFGLGLALQKHLGNLTAGILIIVFKPFRKGDMIETDGVLGNVQEVDILFTKLKTKFGEIVTLPNNKVMSNKVVNYTHTDTLRVKLNLTIRRDDDVVKAQRIIQEIMDNDPRVLKKPKPRVFPLRFSDNGVVITARPWATNADWWDLQCNLVELIKVRFDKEGIALPGTQQDVYIHQTPVGRVPIKPEAEVN